MDAVLESLQTEWRHELPEDLARVPLYHLLYSLLRAAILDGRFGYEHRMPTEQQLTEVFEVSRITARRAMDELAAERLVARRRGKGSHVTHRYRAPALHAPLVGMLDGYRELAKRSRARVISLGKEIPPAAIRMQLGTEEKERVLKIVRSLANDAGVVYSCYTSWTPGAPVGLTKRRLERRSRLELLEEAGIGIDRVRQILGAELARLPVASWLKVKPGTALLSVERRAYDRSDKCIDLVFGLYNPALFKYSVETA